MSKSLLICLWTADCGYLNKALSESSCDPANHKTTETAAYLTFTTVLLALVQTRHNETIYQNTAQDLHLRGFMI